MDNRTVAVLMGSKSDFLVVEKAIKKLKEFEIKTDVFIMSAHKSPNYTVDFAQGSLI